MTSKVENEIVILFACGLDTDIFLLLFVDI